MAPSAIRFGNIILAGLLAGVSFGIWMGFDPSNLTPSTYIEQQQNLDRSLNVLMTALVILATLVSLTSAFFQRDDRPAFVALLLAAGCFVTCILISRFANQPINNIVLTLDPRSPPADWTELRDRWWFFHILRTLSELIAFGLVAWASTRPEPMRRFRR